jgi:chemotaxis protein methyltransferase CheR
MAMRNAAYVQFLRTYMSPLGLRWQGFRRVSPQVIKRLKRRLRALQLQDLCAYRAYLDRHPEEWGVLDHLCRITISRFYRDQEVFARLRTDVLPRLARDLQASHGHTLHCWSAGCAAGEEVYTLKLLWQLSLGSQFPEVELRILATDADPHMLARARRGWYPHSSLRELPPDWMAAGFDQRPQGYVVRDAFREGICFVAHDIRQELPRGRFHLILCRNVVLTYFAVPVQQDVLARMATRLPPGGMLVVGKQESLPPDTYPFVAYDAQHGIFQRLET